MNQTATTRRRQLCAWLIAAIIIALLLGAAS
jgi:hypothetical protein